MTSTWQSLILKKQGKELKSSIPQKIPETDISSQLSLHSSWDDTYYRSKNISYSDQIHKKLKPSTNIPSSLDTEPTLLLINSAYWQCRHLAVEICNARHLSCFQAPYSTTQLFFLRERATNSNLSEVPWKKKPWGIAISSLFQASVLILSQQNAYLGERELDFTENYRET